MAIKVIMALSRLDRERRGPPARQPTLLPAISLFFAPRLAHGVQERGRERVLVTGSNSRSVLFFDQGFPQAHRGRHLSPLRRRSPSGSSLRDESVCICGLRTNRPVAKLCANYCHRAIAFDWGMGYWWYPSVPKWQETKAPNICVLGNPHPPAPP